jgi:hypothetical protein
MFNKFLVLFFIIRNLRGSLINIAFSGGFRIKLCLNFDDV